MHKLIAQTTIKSLLLSFFFLTLSFTSVHAFADGDGSPGDPYVITTCQHLQDIYDNPSSSFVLGSDIDCSDTVNWNSGNGFNPIGGGSDFWGVLDGNYFTVRNLYINRPEENSVGLFRTVEGGVVGSLNFDGADITGADRVGVVSGDAEEGEFYDIHVTNSTVVAEGHDEVGGLLGYGVETIMEECSFNGTVTGGNRVGGLVGYEEVSMNMTNSYNLGTVNGYIRVGGLIGSVEGTLSMVGSYNKGNIVSEFAEIYESYQGVGGLVGAAWQSTILRSYNEGSISTNGGELYVGGLVGGGGLVNIQQSYNVGNISVFSDGHSYYNGTGGILGSGINATIRDSYNWGNISEDLAEGITEGPPIGGITGFTFVSSIRNSYNKGTLTLEGESYNPSSVGGISGKLYFDSSFFDFFVNGYLNRDFLNKVGEYVFELINNFNIGDIFGRSNSILGGLIGSVAYNYNNFDEEFILSNNWWANNISNGIGKILDESVPEENEVNDEVEGSFEKDSLVESFKKYTHKVYNTDPEWDFDEVWSNVYEEKGYPVLGFHNILAPSKPSANVNSGTLGSPFFVTLTSDGSTIRYTLDGTMPTCSTGTLYTSPIYISSSKTVKAVACDEYGLSSILGEFTYTITSSKVVLDSESSDIVQRLISSDIEDTENEKEEDTYESEEESIINDEEQDTTDAEEDGFNWWWLVVVAVIASILFYIVRFASTKEEE
jgi:hypothetical protein